MSSPQHLFSSVRRWQSACVRSTAVFLRDAGQGMLEVSHNSLALLGLLIVGAVLFAAGRSDFRHAIEAQTLSWLQARQEARLQATAAVEPAEPDLGEPDAIQRATAADPRELNRAQASVARYLAQRYHVALEPVSRLVQEAWTVGALVNLDPTLILSVMAVESSFNPFAQSPVGAQGLMQVMTRVHDDKYEPFGGNHAAFDPVTNLRVGVLVLKECIAKAGSVEAGLRFYVGAGNLADDSGYAWKVLAEQQYLRSVSAGRSVAFNAPLPPPPPTATLAKDAVPEAPSDAVGPQPANPPAASPAADKPVPSKLALLN